MIIEEIKNIDSSKKELKKFGITIGLVLVAIGTVLFFLDKPVYYYFIMGHVFFMVSSFVAPVILLPFQKFWMGLSVVLGFFMSRLILSILFYLVITPLGLTAKIFGKDFLDRKIEKDKQSYWNLREIKEYDPIDTERQF